MEYKFTVVFSDVRDFEQADEYTDKIAEFIDSELTKEWCAFVEKVNRDGEVLSLIHILKEWCAENGYSQDWHCPMFKDQITGRMMFDCAFQYYEIEEN